VHAEVFRCCLLASLLALLCYSSTVRSSGEEELVLRCAAGQLSRLRRENYVLITPLSFGEYIDNSALYWRVHVRVLSKLELSYSF